MYQCWRKRLLFTYQANIFQTRLPCQVRVEKSLLEQLNVFVSVKLDKLLQNLMRNSNLLQLATEDKSIQIFEVDRLHTLFWEHFEQFTEKVVDCADPYTKLSCKLHFLIVYLLTLFKLFYAGVYNLFQQVLHTFTHQLLTLFLLVRQSG